MQYTLVSNEDGEKNLTVFVPGKAPLTVHSSHPNFEEVLEGVLAEDERVYDIIDIAAAAARRFERLSERVTIKAGRMYFDGEEVNDALSEQVVRFLKDGEEDWKPLVAFYENLMQNPLEHSREQLYTWLSGRNFTITEDGMIVGYKGVQEQEDEEGNKLLVSVHSGKAIVDGEEIEGQIPNEIGSLIEMPRSEVRHDPQTACHQGLHVGNYRYASTFASVLLEVHVNPRDVVSVPSDSSYEKMRVCRYRVVDRIESEYEAQVVPSYERRQAEGAAAWGDGEGDDTASEGTDCQNCGNWIDAEEYQQTGTDEFCYECSTDPRGQTFGHEEEETEVEPVKAQGGVAVGDKFEDTDKRRAGRTLVVESIDGDTAVVTSLPLGLKRSVKIERLLSRKYRKV